MSVHLTSALLAVLVSTVYCASSYYGWAPIPGSFTTKNKGYKPKWPIYSIGKGEVFIDNTGNDTSTNEVTSHVEEPLSSASTTSPPSNSSLASYLSMMAPILSNTSASNFTMLSYLPVMAAYWSKVDPYNASLLSSSSSYFPTAPPVDPIVTTPNTTLTYTTTERSSSGWRPVVPLSHPRGSHWKPIVPMTLWTSSTVATTEQGTTSPSTTTALPPSTVPPLPTTTPPSTSTSLPPSTSSQSSTTSSPANQTIPSTTSTSPTPIISATATATATISSSTSTTSTTVSSTATTTTSTSPQPDSLVHNLRALLRLPSSTPQTRSVSATPSSNEMSDSIPTRSTPRSIQSTTFSRVTTYGVSPSLASRSSVTTPPRVTSPPSQSISVDFERIALHSDNCTRLFTINKGGELFFSFNLAANLLDPCKLTFRGPPGEKIALQLTEISLAQRDDRALGDPKGGCDEDAISVFSHPEGILFMTDQLCEKEQSSSLLVTDTQSPVVTLSYDNTAASYNDTSANFNLHVFTYIEDNATTLHV